MIVTPPLPLQRTPIAAIVVAVTARRPVAAITAETIAAAVAEAAAAAAEAAATLVALAVAIDLAHHRGGAFLEFVDADGEIAQHVFVDALLALDLGQRRRAARRR